MRRWLTVVTGAAVLAITACGGSSGSKTSAVKLPIEGCGLLDNNAVMALLGAPATESYENPDFSSGAPPNLRGSVIGCTWSLGSRAAPRQAVTVLLHQSPTAAAEFADNTQGAQRLAGFGDNAVIRVSSRASGEDSVDVLKADVAILVAVEHIDGTRSSSVEDVTTALKSAATMILDRISSG